MSKYLITGVNGYLGGTLAKRLHEEGHIVHGVLREGSELREDLVGIVSDTLHYKHGEFIHLDEMRETPWDYDGVFHLAALYSTKRDADTEYDLLQSNIVYTSDLIRKVNDSLEPIPIVYASTFSAYDENNNPARNNLYSYTKMVSEKLLQNHADYSTVLVMSDTYGPNDTRNKVHDLLVNNKLSELHSPGDQEMVLNHIEDVARAFIYAMNLLHESIEKKGVSRLYAKYGLMYEENRVTLDELIELLGSSAKCLGKNPKVGIPQYSYFMPGFELKYNVKDIKKVIKGE